MKRTKTKPIDIAVRIKHLCQLHSSHIFDFEDWEDRRIARFLFKNYRDDDAGGCGLRLSDTGLEILKQFCEHWVLELPASFRIKAKNLIVLDNQIKYPWYLGRGILVLFDRDESLLLKMIDCDLDLFYDMHS